jgi:Family of unknown function (DUF6535)
MYLDRVIEEDNKMVESWKGDADGMLVFVSFQTTTSGTSAFNVEIIDWSFLCRNRDFARSLYPGYSAEPAKHVSFLSCTYLSAIF